jgi:hypothetical protein
MVNYTDDSIYVLNLALYYSISCKKTFFFVVNFKCIPKWCIFLLLNQNKGYNFQNYIWIPGGANAPYCPPLRASMVTPYTLLKAYEQLLPLWLCCVLGFEWFTVVGVKFVFDDLPVIIVDKKRFWPATVCQNVSLYHYKYLAAAWKQCESSSRGVVGSKLEKKNK